MSKHYVPSTAKRILKALSSGQLHKHGICRALGCNESTVNTTMAEMRRRGEVIVLGSCEEAGYSGVYGPSPVYGLPGMTLQKVPSKVKPKTESGSGQFAEPNRGFEFKPLRRDLFAHMKLALVGR